MRPLSLDKWVDSARKLLDIERQEEIQMAQQELELLNDAENPNVLPNLRLEHWSTGLFGRVVFKLAFPSRHLQQAKPHQFTVGDLVQLRLKKLSTVKNAVFPTGIVARVEDTSISIALNADQEIEEEELLSQALTLDRLVNNATFVKITSALDQLAKFDYGHAQSVIDIVFNGKTPSWNIPLPTIQPFNEGLNESQLEAIRFALASKDLALIHGPPGTGKTTTVVEFIMQAVRVFKMKVLVCAPSNIAVDNVLEKTATSDPKLLLTRIGHPARLLPQVLRHCLDARIQDADGTQIVQDIRQEMVEMEKQLKKTKNKTERREIRGNYKANRKEIRQREQKVVQEILKQSDVVFATNVGASSKLLTSIKDLVFDVVIIDEAAQALEASCWIPILKGKKCILAGDHLQLPPTIKSKKAAQQGLEMTLFDRMTRLDHTKDSGIVKMLKIQYRMHEKISEWSSNAMYKGELKSHPNVATRKLSDLSHVSLKEKEEDEEKLNATLLLIDTAGCDLQEDIPEQEDFLFKLSKSNEGEANIVEKHVRALLTIGLKQEEIAIITPYNKQVQCLKSKFTQEFPKLEIRSVDGFQGCEKEAVVMSLVRSNDRKEVGFLADDRRMNVAITRAKRHVALVCDTETICAHPFLKQLVEHFEKKGEYRSAQEYLDEDLIEADFFQLTAPVPVSVPVSGASSSKSKPSAAHKKTASPTSTTTANKNKNKKTVLVPVPVPASSATKEIQAEPLRQEQKEVILEEEKEEDDEEDEELEEKAKFSGSLFQLLPSDSDSDSSSEKNSEEEVSDSDSESTLKEDEAKAQQEANDLLKSLHLSRMTRQPPPVNAPHTSTGEGRGGNKKRKKKKKEKGSVVQVEFSEEEDELAFLDRQVSNSTKCSYRNMSSTLQNCKKSTQILGSVCICCKLKFCYEHAQPEIHGCGQAIRQHERQQFLQQMSLRPSTTDHKSLTKDKRKLLQKKLEEKVHDQTTSRSSTKAKAKANPKAKAKQKKKN